MPNRTTTRRVCGLICAVLLLDAGNPRSLVFQLERSTEDLDALPATGDRRLRDEQRLVLEASTSVRLADTAALVVHDDAGNLVTLRELLDRVLALLRGRLENRGIARRSAAAPAHARRGASHGVSSGGRGASSSSCNCAAPETNRNSVCSPDLASVTVADLRSASLLSFLIMPLSDMRLIISPNVLRSTRMCVASSVSVKVPR